jgi:uncharacterized protein
VTATRSRKIFVNLPVRDLKRSIDFFRKLGFEFNPQFTDESAACMVLSEEGYVMLLSEPRFKDFARKPVADARSVTGGLYALTADSRAEVDALVKAAIAAGGSPAAEPQDHGFMYFSSFYDPDGHHWEVFWMDPAHVQK